MKIWIKFFKKIKKRREKRKEKVCSCIVLDEEKSRQNCYTTSPAHLATFTFPADILFQDSSSSSILELTVQNTMKDQQICNIIISHVILSEGYHLSEMSDIVSFLDEKS